MKRILLISIVIMATFLPSRATYAEARFPEPEFESDYSAPSQLLPDPRAGVMEYIDLLVLTAALALASWLILKKRSRKAVFLLTIFSLLYFGFYRNGCICPVGSIQNVTLALFDQCYSIPITVLGFFLLPLIFSLFFGRSFCGAVCPLGAIQDVVILKPIKVPGPAAEILKLIPYIYLGAAVLLAATGSAFIICRLDPFVAFFRLTGKPSMLIFGAVFIITGVFIARPYCRFFCPYGVLLNWMSRFSLKHMTITPSDCVQCRLCEDSCPFDVINKPIEGPSPEPVNKGIRRLWILFLLLPLLALFMGYLGSRLDIPLSRVDNIIILSEQIQLENSGQAAETTLRSDAFRAAGQPTSQLLKRAVARQKELKTGGWLLGAFIGLVIGLKLIALSTRRTNSDYQPDRAECFSCARCIPYCPVESPDGEKE